ncbi:protein phosphatase 2A regulatory B subunit [Pseudozyma hubeiensis SY62]|uniref:Protein phosphatase 2A regulatory B subunit n=1 Tax=Pseudozyma hubeiensis (strain SY62) TaxID=1305764 RepID=R9PKZ4_PSEHS|nr:protein phosphatase 2A regulatory B subunit [Pseudozyma hubeiensis SY62]GAC98765.1 protein phosphatase 2A regulatory B subunit [Pseudozyma hubeiensis SY62]
MDVFDWPADAAEKIGTNYHLQANDQHYDELVADEFLANALLHLTRMIRQKTSVQAAWKVGPSDWQLKTVSLLPAHRLVTEGLKQGRTRGTLTSPWFSLPLMVADPYNPEEIDYAHFELPSGEALRSFDLIRFDKFKTATTNGFWLPTGIVRPFTAPGRPESLRFKMVNEFPTSAARYRKRYKHDPAGATASLQQALQAKRPIWLSKLVLGDRETIAAMWQRAVHDPSALIESPFFTREERQAWKNEKSEAPDEGKLSASTSQPRPDTIHISSSSEKEREVEASPEPVNPSDKQPMTVHPLSQVDRLDPPSGGNDESDRYHKSLEDRLKIVSYNGMQPQNEGFSQWPPMPLHDRIASLYDRKQPAPHLGYHSNFVNPPMTLYERTQLSSAPSYAKQDVDGASTRGAESAVYTPSGSTYHPGPLTEHDFLNQHGGVVPVSPVRPRPRYPWEIYRGNTPQDAQVDPSLPYLQSLYKEKGIDLSLSLSHQQPGEQRNPKSA